ncbi:MAG: hypothetical protein U0744_18325 [Gemmataceae bacterium]
MDNLKASFEDVADWCEKHLEAMRGREIGLTLGAMLRAYARLATLPARLSDDERAALERQLNAKAEKLLFDFSTRFFAAYESSKSRIVEPMSMRTNMTYDPGPHPPG